MFQTQVGQRTREVDLQQSGTGHLHIARTESIGSIGYNDSVAGIPGAREVAVGCVEVEHTTTHLV